MDNDISKLNSDVESLKKLVQELQTKLSNIEFKTSDSERTKLNRNIDEDSKKLIREAVLVGSGNDATKFWGGDGVWDTVKDSDLSLSDITTNDVSTSKHGFVPKAPNDTTKYLRGDATWATLSTTLGYVTGGTATSANNIDITGLDLDTHTKYIIWVKWAISSLSATSDITITLNSDTSSGNYGWAKNNYGRRNDVSASSQSTGENTNFIEVCDDFANGFITIELWQVTNGANEFKLLKWSGIGQAPQVTSQAREVTVINGAGNWSDTANVTSIQVDIANNADTADWEYRVYRLLNS